MQKVTVKNNMDSSVKLVMSLVGAVIGVALILILLPFTIVDAGEKAVITSNGAVSHVVGAGFHLVMPVIQGVVKYDVRTQKEQTDASAASSDLQTVNTTVAINYSINPDTVADMYTRIGTADQVKGKVIDPAIQEVVKAATAKYTATDLLTKRAEVTALIKQGLVERCELRILALIRGGNRSKSNSRADRPGSKEQARTGSI